MTNSFLVSFIILGVPSLFGSLALIQLVIV